MSAFTDGHGNSPTFLVNDYPWETIGSGTVVDVGGSNGHVGILLTREYPKLRCIVQELSDMIVGAAEALPADVKDRIEFQKHDFFTEQTVQADVYLFRYIFHDWSDSNAIRILKALVPALRQGARIVINDYVLPEPGTMSLLRERVFR
jgi:predicted O-methyltransferase YrrM